VPRIKADKRSEAFAAKDSRNLSIVDTEIRHRCTISDFRLKVPTEPQIPVYSLQMIKREEGCRVKGKL
jgi:hypothetical protein